MTLKHGVSFRSLIPDPLIIFLVVGGAFFLVYAGLEKRTREPVHYSLATQKTLTDEFEMLTGRKATNADKAQLEKNFIADELLFREAVSRGMYLTDSQIKKRLIDKVRFLIAGAPPEPTEEQLVNYYADNLNLYQTEPKTSFEQVYFAKPPADPNAVLAELASGQKIAGDDFWQGRNFPLYGDSMVRVLFGQPFVDALARIPANRWQGPYKSSRGYHFVRKTERVTPHLMPYAEVHEQVRQDFMMSKTNSAIDSEIEKLKGKYDVEIDR